MCRGGSVHADPRCLEAHNANDDPCHRNGHRGAVDPCWAGQCSELSLVCAPRRVDQLRLCQLRAMPDVKRLVRSQPHVSAADRAAVRPQAARMTVRDLCLCKAGLQEAEARLEWHSRRQQQPEERCFSTFAPARPITATAPGAVESVGFSTVTEDCSMRTFEQCRLQTIAGNRGFCIPHPRWTGAYGLAEPPRRTGKRRVPSR
jgi:hypothetical protein